MQDPQHAVVRGYNNDIRPFNKQTAIFSPPVNKQKLLSRRTSGKKDGRYELGGKFPEILVNSVKPSHSPSFIVNTNTKPMESIHSAIQVIENVTDSDRRRNELLSRSLEPIPHRADVLILKKHVTTDDRLSKELNVSGSSKPY